MTEKGTIKVEKTERHSVYDEWHISFSIHFTRIGIHRCDVIVPMSSEDEFGRKHERPMQDAIREAEGILARDIIRMARVAADLLSDEDKDRIKTASQKQGRSALPPSADVQT